MTSSHQPVENETADGLRGWLADVAAAAALLSILPVPAAWQRGAVWPRALRALPLAGMGIGTTSATAWWLAMAAGMGEMLAALLALLAGVVISGALHEDGLADFADALGGRTREQRLKIMRDARIGSFGVLALLFALALQAAALVQLATDGAMVVLAALVLAHGASRLAALWLMHALPNAREEGMSAGCGRPSTAMLAQAALPVALLLGLAWMLLPGWQVLATATGAVMVAVLFRQACRRLLDGQTGDAAGALEVLVRCAMLLGLAAG